MFIESVMPSNHLILCRPLLLLSSIFPSIRVFSSESLLHIRWPKYWSFSFSISPSNEYSALISFRMDWLDFLALQGTLESSSTPQFKSINSSALSSALIPVFIRIPKNFLKIGYCSLRKYKTTALCYAILKFTATSWKCLSCLHILFWSIFL